MKNETKNHMAEEMIARYGETMRGSDLFRALGFRTYSGFYKANKNNKLPVRVFALPGRRGYFALTVAVAQFLITNGCSDIPTGDGLATLAADAEPKN